MNIIIYVDISFICSSGMSVSQFVTRWNIISVLTPVKYTVAYDIMGRRGRDRMVLGFTTTYSITLITTNVVSSNPVQARCTRYNIMW